jgi:hypothetical protein
MALISKKDCDCYSGEPTSCGSCGTQYMTIEATELPTKKEIRKFLEEMDFPYEASRDAFKVYLWVKSLAAE